jgi:hypothetical protein
MSPQTLERVSTDWFDLVIQQLDLLREDCELVDEESVAPSHARFEMAKTAIENLRLLAEFPNLPEPDVWAGVNGEIGITLVFPRGTLELVIIDRVHARILNSNEQAAVELSQVPVLLQRLSAQSAA